jgi:GntR family transcriptional regulator
MVFDSGQPIYRQIIDDYQKQLVRGELQPGDKIPSQREYAQTHQVNPNTVQRAYREMEAMQMVETIRGQGTFVRVGGAELQRIRMDMAAEVLEYFIEEMRSLGFTQEDILQMTARALGQKEVEADDRV